MSKNRQAYISGPYTGYTREATVKNVLFAINCGFNFCLKHDYLPIIPHVSFGHDQTWSQAMVKCLELISKMDASMDIMVMLPGWEKSSGAKIEKEFAKIMGIKTFYYDDMV